MAPFYHYSNICERVSAVHTDNHGNEIFVAMEQKSVPKN